MHKVLAEVPYFLAHLMVVLGLLERLYCARGAYKLKLCAFSVRRLDGGGYNYDMIYKRRRQYNLLAKMGTITTYFCRTKIAQY
jgi:hypothetical protein